MKVLGHDSRRILSCIRRILCSIRRKNWTGGMGLGFFAGFCFQLGARLAEGKWAWADSTEATGFVLRILLSGFLLGLVAAVLYQWLESQREITGREKTQQPGRTVRTQGHFLLFYGLFLLCYLICFLAYFPGIMSYDSWYITLEALGMIGFDNHHPFLHTLIWSLFARMDDWLGIDQIGIALYTTVQFLVMTAVYACAMNWIWRRRTGKGVKIILLLYYVMNPVFHIFSLILTKDVLFSGVFLLTCLCTADFLEEGKRTEQLTILFLLCCLLRNNMVYVGMVFTVCLFLFGSPKRRQPGCPPGQNTICRSLKERACCCRGFLIALLLYYFITGIIYPSMGVGAGSRKEMMSVPASQLAAVYQKEQEQLTEKEKELILKYVPSASYYDRFFADPVKGDFNTGDYEADSSEFWQLWSLLLRKYPGDYAEAFLSLNLPFWYPGMDSVREYIETDNYSKEEYPVSRLNILPGVLAWYEKVADYEAEWMKLPVFKWLFSLATPVWLLLFWLTAGILQKRRGYVLALLLPILLWMTYLLGPVSALRYAEPLMLTGPVWLVLGLERKKG